MIDFFGVFHKGGAIVWSHGLSPIEGNPLEHFVQEVLLEERKGTNIFRYGDYALKWVFANEFDLVFVAIYLNLTSMLYMDDLLEAVRDNFVSMFRKGTQETEMYIHLPFL